MTETRAVGMMRARTGMTGGAKGMTERVNVVKDGERPVGKTKGRAVERTGIPGRAGNDGDESWNDGERAKEMMRKRTGMTERKQRENSGKGEREGRMKGEER